MTQLPELLDALNKAGYIDDDIRCEDNEDVIKEYNEIVWKYKSEAKVVKIYELLIKRGYIHDSDEEAFWFINAYFYFIENSQWPKY